MKLRGTITGIHVHPLVSEMESEACEASAVYHLCGCLPQREQTVTRMAQQEAGLCCLKQTMAGLAYQEAASCFFLHVLLCQCTL